MARGSSTRFSGSGGSQRNSGGIGPISLPAIGVTNGFLTSAEPPALVIANEDTIAKFSMPQEILTFKPPMRSIVHAFKNGDRERKIHCNVKLPDEEVKSLKQLQELAKTKGCVFFPSLSARGTRYLTNARGDLPKALAMMQATNAWRMNFFRIPLSERTLAEELRYGIAYWCGRDSELRPLLVFRANRIPKAWHKVGNYDNVVRVVVFCLEYFLRYMTVPGVVEAFSIIVDLADLSIGQIPVQALKEMHKEMGNHYTVRVLRMYICNMSFFLRGVFTIAKSILSDRQNQKICVINSLPELHKHFALHQLEKDFGGTKENIHVSFPFDLSPGPFTAGYTGGPNENAVTNVHRAFDLDALCGRLWDPELSPEENTRQNYTPEAPSIFRQCNIPVPNGCPSHEESSQSELLSQPSESSELHSQLGLGVQAALSLPECGKKISDRQTCLDAISTTHVELHMNSDAHEKNRNSVITSPWQGQTTLLWSRQSEHSKQESNVRLPYGAFTAGVIDEFPDTEEYEISMYNDDPLCDRQISPAPNSWFPWCSCRPWRS